MGFNPMQEDLNPKGGEVGEFLLDGGVEVQVGPRFRCPVNTADGVVGVGEDVYLSLLSNSLIDEEDDELEGHPNGP